MTRKHVHLPARAEAAHDTILPAPPRTSAGGVNSLAAPAPSQLPTPDSIVGQHEVPIGAPPVRGRLRRVCTFMAVHAAKGAVSSVGGLLVTAVWVYLSHR